MHYAVIFLLLSACASAPQEPAQNAAPGSVYVESGIYAGPAPAVPAMSSVPCTTNYLSAMPSPPDLYPCPMPLWSAYPAYGYAPPLWSPYPAYGYAPPLWSPYPAYGYAPPLWSPYPTYGYGLSLYGAPFYSVAYVRRAVPSTPRHTHTHTHTHTGRRGKR